MTDKDLPSVLIVDDDEVFRERLCRAFRLRGWDAQNASGHAAALDSAGAISPDLAIVDLKMPGESGLDVVRDLRDLDGTITIIMLTGYGSIATALEAVRLGANHYLSKPVDVDQILAAYQSVVAADSAVETEDRPATTVPSLARVEWEHIQRVLTDCSGNVSQAAKLLGIHRRSLQRKLMKNPPRE